MTTHTKKDIEAMEMGVAFFKHFMQTTVVNNNDGPTYKSLTDDEIEQHYIDYFKLTHTYATSQRRKNFVNFAQFILKMAQQR
jgi:hypothetical protein